MRSFEAGGAHALAGEFVLLARDRRGGDVAAVMLRGMQREAAPAGADLDDAIVAPTSASLRQMRSSLRVDALSSDSSARSEDRRRVHQVVVEEQFEEIVAEIVVRGDVAAAAARACCAAAHATRACAMPPSRASPVSIASSRSRLRTSMRISATRSSHSQLPSMYASPAPTLPFAATLR